MDGISNGTAGSQRMQYECVSIAYGGALGQSRVISDFSMTVDRGEIVVLIGQSGCGKTSVLHAGCGLVAPETGRVTVDGRAAVGPTRDRILVFQDPVLFPWLTVAENVAFGMKGAAHTSAGRGVDVRSTLAELHLDQCARQYPYQLSGGMRQRAQLGRAMLMQPSFLLLDEPFGALDALTRLQMQGLLQELVQEHRPGVVFVTHDVDEALTLATRVHLIKGRPGRIDYSADISGARPRLPSHLNDPAIVTIRKELLERLGVEVERGEQS